MDGGEVVQMDTAAMADLVGWLAGWAAEMEAGAGGSDRAIPPLPRDDHGLGLAFVALDEARERFDRRVAGEGRELMEFLAVVHRQVVVVDTAPVGVPGAG